MTAAHFSAAFIAEGSSDAPLSGIVERLFLERGVSVRVTAPPFELLGKKVGKDLASRLAATEILMRRPPEIVIVHRDADNQGSAARLAEMEAALTACGWTSQLVPIVPVRMTEAWLLLDEEAIRRTAGNPSGRTDLALPNPGEVERRSDPKALLREALLVAAAESGRRRQRVAQRFEQHRRQLLESLDIEGPVTMLSSWTALVDAVDGATRRVGDAD